MEKKFRIGFVSGDILDVGGVETHLLAIFNSLGCSAFQPVLIAPASANFAKNVQEAGTEFIYWANESQSFLGQILFLYRIFKKQRLSFIHIHSPGVTIGARISAWAAGIESLLTVHLHPRDYFGTRTAMQRLKWVVYSLFNCLENILLKGMSIYVSGRAFENDVLLRCVNRNSALVIPNGVAPVAGYLAKHIQPEVGFREEDTKDRLVLCFVGRLEDQKGIDVLLRSVFTLQKSVLDSLELWVIGSGSRKASYEALTEKLGLAGKVHFWGQQHCVGDFLCRADMFVLPSNHEGMSISLLEALAYGLPCIVTEAGENSALVKNGVNGFVVSVGDVAGISKAITILAGDAGLRRMMGDASRLVAREFSLDEMLAKTMQVYQQTIAS